MTADIQMALPLNPHVQFNSTSATINDLSPELLNNILIHSDPVEISRLNKVCKSIREHIHDLSEVDVNRINQTTDSRHLIYRSLTGKMRLLVKSDFDKQVAANPILPKNLLRILTSLEMSSKVLGGVASNPNLPEDLLRKLASKQNDVDVRRGAASNPNAPEDVLRLLAENANDTEILMAIASNPKTPADLLRTLTSQNYHDNVRFKAVSNPNIPEEVLLAFASNLNEPLDRAAAASNPKIPLHILEILSEDANQFVRSSVGSNLKTPVRILQKLLIPLDTDSLPWVVSLAVASNPNLPEKTIRELALHEYYSVRAGIAGNASTPEDILRKFASNLSTDDDNEWILRCLVSNPKLPKDCLEKLATYKQGYVSYFVAKNPNTPDQSLRNLALNEKQDVSNKALANLLLKSLFTDNSLLTVAV